MHTVYNPDMYSAVDYGILGFLAGLGFFIWFFIIVLGILQLIGEWFVFDKAERNGWEILIPFHNLFVKFQIAGINPAWTLAVIFGALINIIPIIGTIIYTIGMIVIDFWLNIKLAKSFGKGTGFGIGLTLLPVVFFPILGFDNASYIKDNIIVEEEKTEE